MTITGSNFEQGAVWCRFGDAAPIKGTWLASVAVVCAAPTHTIGTVQVDVSNNGVDWTSAGLNSRYRYVAAAHVSWLSISSGPVLGRSLVTVRGTGFVQSAHFCCKFGLLVVPASQYIRQQLGEGIFNEITACSAPTEVEPPRKGIFNDESSQNVEDEELCAL